MKRCENIGDVDFWLFKKENLIISFSFQKSKTTKHCVFTTFHVRFMYVSCTFHVRFMYVSCACLGTQVSPDNFPDATVLWGSCFGLVSSDFDVFRVAAVSRGSARGRIGFHAGYLSVGLTASPRVR